MVLLEKSTAIDQRTNDGCRGDEYAVFSIHRHCQIDLGPLSHAARKDLKCIAARVNSAARHKSPNSSYHLCDSSFYWLLSCIY